MAEFIDAQRAIESGIHSLQRRMSSKAYAEVVEPESVRILKSKNDKEKEYLQRTIVMMELKQIAESITMVVGRKRMDPG